MIFKNLPEISNERAETEFMGRTEDPMRGWTRVETSLGKWFSCLAQVRNGFNKQMKGSEGTGSVRFLESWEAKLIYLARHSLPKRNKLLLLTAEVLYMDASGPWEELAVWTPASLSLWGTKLGGKCKVFWLSPLQDGCIPVPPAFCSQLNPGQVTPHSLFPLTSQLTWNKGFSVACGI